MVDHTTMNITKTVAVGGLLGFLFAVTAFGQPKTLLPVDHPELYASYCFFMEEFGKSLDARGTTISATNKTKLMQSAARYLKVDVTEIPKLTAACQTVTARLRQIGADAAQYRDGESKNHRDPDRDIVLNFEAQRRAAIQDGISQMRQALSAKGWNGLQTHINGEYRAGVQVLDHRP
jgi:hypothetical protein